MLVYINCQSSRWRFPFQSPAKHVLYLYKWKIKFSFILTFWMLTINLLYLLSTEHRMMKSNIQQGTFQTKFYQRKLNLHMFTFLFSFQNIKINKKWYRMNENHLPLNRRIPVLLAPCSYIFFFLRKCTMSCLPQNSHIAWMKGGW